MLLEYDVPPKIHKLKKGVFFDLLPMDILNEIYDWLIGLEHIDKFKTVVVCIKIPLNPALQMLTHKKLTPYIFFGN